MRRVGVNGRLFVVSSCRIRARRSRESQVLRPTVIDQASTSRPGELEQDGCLATADRSQESVYWDSCLIKKSLFRGKLLGA